MNNNKKRIVFLLLLLVFLHAISAYAEDLDRDFKSLQDRLEGIVASSDRLSMSVLGHVQYKNKYPIWLVKFKGSDHKKNKLLISGGAHGDEPAGTEAVLSFIKKAASSPDKYKSLNIDFIPLMNPSGWVSRSRLTDGGKDVNRGFHLQDSQEAMIINDYLSSRKRYKLMIDHHEDPRYPGYYMVSYGNGSPLVIFNIMQKIESEGFQLRPFKKNNGWFNVSKKKTPKLKNKTFMSYARMNYSKRVYQVESPTKPALSNRVEMHTLAADLLIDSILNRH